MREKTASRSRNSSNKTTTRRHTGAEQARPAPTRRRVPAHAQGRARMAAPPGLSLLPPLTPPPTAAKPDGMDGALSWESLGKQVRPFAVWKPLETTLRVRLTHVGRRQRRGRGMLQAQQLEAELDARLLAYSKLGASSTQAQRYGAAVPGDRSADAAALQIEDLLQRVRYWRAPNAAPMRPRSRVAFRIGAARRLRGRSSRTWSRSTWPARWTRCGRPRPPRRRTSCSATARSSPTAGKNFARSRYAQPREQRQMGES